MKIASFQGEKSLSELVSRLYKIRGPRAEAQARAAEEALLRANPHLLDLESLPAGAIIRVPDVRGVKTADTGLAAANLPSDIVEAAGQAVSAARTAAEASVTLHETQ